MFSAYTIYDAVLNLGFFFTSILNSPALDGNTAYFSLYSVACAIFIVTGSHFTYFFVKKPLKGMLRIFFYALAGIPLLFLAASPLLRITGFHSPSLGWFLQFDYVLCLACVYFAVFRLFGARNVIKSNFFGISMVKVLVFGFFMFPIGILQIYWNFYGNSPLRPLSIENFYYFIVNGISAVVFARFYLINPREAMPAIAELNFPFEIEKCLREFSRMYGITERETEIIRCIQLGLTNKEIAERLFIAPITVKNHIYNIYAKTLASTRIELVNLVLYGNPANDSAIMPADARTYVFTANT